MPTDETSTQRIALDGADTAPVINFDAVPFFGFLAGKGRLTLEAAIQDERPDGNPMFRRRAIAHLHMTEEAMRSLRDALNGIDLLQAQMHTPEGAVN